MCIVFLQPPAPLVKVVTGNKMSDTLDSDKPHKGTQVRRARSSTAPARGKENRGGPAEKDWEEVVLKFCFSLTEHR